MASTYTPALRIEDMATGDQSGTWGDTTDNNYALFEQAITGFLSVAQGDVANLTLTSLDGAIDQARNAVLDITGAMTANRNVVVPTSEKVYLFKNSTTGGFVVTVKTVAGTGVTIPNGTARWVYCDGTNVVDALSGPWTPSANDGQALGASGTAWADLFLASGGVINWNAGNYTLTHSAGLLTTNGALTVGGAATASTFVPNSSSAPTDGMYLPAASTLGWSVGSAAEMQLTSTALSPAADGGSSLGTTALGWQNLFGNTGFVLNIEGGNWVATHTSGIMTVGTGDLRVTTAGTNTASVATVGGTQTLTAKTLTSPTITTSPTAAGATWTDLGSVTTVDINGGTVDGAVIGGASAAAGTFTTLTATGAFTSLGIDDNATGERLQLTDTIMSMGTSGAQYTVAHAGNNSTLYLSGGTDDATGANILLYGGAHASAAGDLGWRSSGTNVYYWDLSANTHYWYLSGASTLQLGSGSIYPTTNDGVALGGGSNAYSDLFLASGGVINWNNGDVTITHAANALAFAGASSGYTFDAAVSITGASGAEALQLTGVPNANYGSLRIAANSGNLLYQSYTELTIAHRAAVGFDAASNLMKWRQTDATGTVRMSLDMSSGLLNLPYGQIQFPATQNSSSNANTLDDYEEGTWTPDIRFGGATTGITYSTRTGSYTKIGNQVICKFYIFLSSKGSATSTASIAGFPFTMAANNGAAASFTGTLTSAGAVTGLFVSAGTVMTLYLVTTTGSTVLTDANFNNTSELAMTFACEV